MTEDRQPKVEEWLEERLPTESELERKLNEQGLTAYRWSNRPGDTYGRHSHPFHKVIYVVHGSIVFVLPDRGEQIALKEGDRLDLPKGVTHEAIVGPNGVTCLEAHQS